MQRIFFASPYRQFRARMLPVQAAAEIGELAEQRGIP